MIEANNTESGKTKGTTLGILNNKNFKITIVSKSFPANSAMKSQMVCRIKIKNKITNTEVNVNRKVRKMYLSKIFNGLFYRVEVVVGVFGFVKFKLTFG